MKLGRKELFDPRSRDYPLLLTTAQKRKPRSYTWRCSTMLDQGRQAACVGFGMAHELNSRPAESSVDTPLARKIYHEAQKIDPWPGGDYPGASPRYEGTAVLSGLKIGQRLGYYKNYRWTFSLDDLVVGVGYHGPAVIGVAWYEGMGRPDSNGFIHPTGRVMGGHCCLVNKVNVREGYFGIVNSWGTGWGNKGTCKISIADMGHLLSQRGEAAFCLKRKTKPKP